MSKIIDTVLLLALPASGKSEVRTWLASVPAKECVRDFHIGETVQLDDYPYVHFMRCIDNAMRDLGKAGPFFHANDRPFKDPRDWRTLIELLNEDYAALKGGTRLVVKDPMLHLFERIDSAALRAGGPVRLALLPPDVVTALRPALEPEAAKIVMDLEAGKPDSLEGRTIVIEFARGGAAGSTMPLFDPFGYKASLAQLSRQILENAGILYIAVTPEESRRKNYERTDPNDPGSILNHGVPIDVMLGDYGCDDMEWLLSQSDVPGTVRVEKGGQAFHVPLAVFDNHGDRTTFVRRGQPNWKKEEVEYLRDGLKAAFDHLYGLR